MDTLNHNTGRLAELMASHLKSFRNAILAVLVLLVISVLPLVALIVGARAIEECPIQSLIPVWLVVTGAIGVAGCCFLIFLLLCQVSCCYRYDTRDDDAPLMTCFCCLSCVLMLFYFAWMIAGAVWTFSAKQNVQFDRPGSSDYCDQSAFNYAFGLVITQICIAGLFDIIVFCSIFIVAWNKYSAY